MKNIHGSVTIVALLYRLQDRNMTTKDAYKYFVLRAQEIAVSKNWSPVNWCVLNADIVMWWWISYCCSHNYSYFN